MATIKRQEIAACLRAPRENWLVLDTVDSTNTNLKYLALEGVSDGTVLIASAAQADDGQVYGAPRFSHFHWKSSLVPCLTGS